MKHIVKTLYGVDGHIGHAVQISDSGADAFCVGCGRYLDNEMDSGLDYMPTDADTDTADSEEGIDPQNGGEFLVGPRGESAGSRMD